MSPRDREIQVGMLPRLHAFAHLWTVVLPVACALMSCVALAPVAVGQSDDWSPDQLLVPSAEDVTDTVLELLGQLRTCPPEQRDALERRLEEVVALRHQLLGAMIKDQPEKVIRCALSASDRESLHGLLRHDLEAPVEIEGTVSVLSEEQGPGTGFEYALDSEAGVYGMLHFTGDPPQLLPGTRVRVAGVLLDKEIAVTGIASLEAPAEASRVDNADGASPVAAAKPLSPPSPLPTPSTNGQ